MNGKVWIVGAGSEAGLITVKGLEAVRGAQVIIYDDLLDRALLEEAPAGCELICVGKRKNSHKKEQEEIHELLIDRARGSCASRGEIRLSLAEAAKRRWLLRRPASPMRSFPASAPAFPHLSTSGSR